MMQTAFPVTEGGLFIFFFVAILLPTFANPSLHKAIV
jgi:hypothetical protein